MGDSAGGAAGGGRRRGARVAGDLVGPGARGRRGRLLPHGPRRRAAGLRQDPPGGPAGVLHHRGERADLAPGAGGRRRAGGAGRLHGEGGRPNHLVLEWIDEGRPTARTEADLGRALAALHAAAPATFGREDRRTTGSRGLPNEPCDDWATFYATQRLAPLARLARDGGALAERAIAGLERLDAGRLREVGGPPEPPARLHGDLWAGNRLVGADGRSWLIDPACHGGHREFDLAMMRLFGGFGADVFAAYAEAAPLADGWEDRVPLHQIAPLVVHAVKFGGGYGPAAADAIARYA